MHYAQDEPQQKLWISYKCGILNKKCQIHFIYYFILIASLNGQFYAISFYKKIRGPQNWKNVIIYQNTLNGNYWCQKKRQRGVAKLDFLRPPKFFQNWVSHKKCPQGPHFQGKVQVLYLFGKLLPATNRCWREKSLKRSGKLMPRVARWKKLDPVSLELLNFSNFWKKF